MALGESINSTHTQLAYSVFNSFSKLIKAVTYHPLSLKPSSPCLLPTQAFHPSHFLNPSIPPKPSNIPMRPQPLLHQPLIPLPIPRIPPHSITNLHHPPIKPLRIPPLKKPPNISLLLPAREPTQTALNIPIQHHHIAPQFLVNSFPVRLHVLPHLVPGDRVRGQSDGARVCILDGDLGAELEVQEVVRQRGGLHAGRGIGGLFLCRLWRLWTGRRFLGGCRRARRRG